MNQGMSILSPKSFPEINSLVFYETLDDVKGLCSVVYDRAGYFENNIFATNVYVIGKSSHQLFLNLVYNESLFHLLYSCADLIFGGKSGS